MSRKREAVMIGIGILAGLALSGPAAAAADYLQAIPSRQTFYVNGQKVEFEAYSIHGNNFVKVRDIGNAVDFGVTYDGATNSVHIDPNAHYQEETPQPTPTPTPTPTPAPSGKYTINVDHWSREDFSQQANPAVFTGVYDRNLYNTIRQTLVDGDAIDPPAYTMVAKGADYSAVNSVMGRLDNVKWFELYVPANFTNYWQYLDYFAVSSKIPPQFEAPLAFIQPVIAEVNRLGSEREKVTYLNDYLCSLLVYDKNEYAGVPQIFTPHNNELGSDCGAYAVAFKFLCGAADIPCFTISTTTRVNHIWNMVYVDGQWFHVDVSTNDSTHSHTMLLQETYPNHPDQAPEATAFIKELLVPGSTK